MDSKSVEDTNRYRSASRRVFQAYCITCDATGLKYIGITSTSLTARWKAHTYRARRYPGAAGLMAAIVRHGHGSFIIEALCCARSWADIAAVEPLLIEQWRTMEPHGYNLAPGGQGGYGYVRTPESIERSASKHRGRPCHPNTKARSERPPQRPCQIGGPSRENRQR
jgi:hypothetical protein